MRQVRSVITREFTSYAVALPWLVQAQEDLQTAQTLFDNQRFGPCAFFCQQSAEKALKAILYYRDKRPWGHRLLGLLGAVQEHVSDLLSEDLQQAAESLDTHYTTPRYPDAHRLIDDAGIHDLYDEDIALEALHHARIFLALAEQEVQP